MDRGAKCRWFRRASNSGKVFGLFQGANISHHLLVVFVVAGYDYPSGCRSTHVKGCELLRHFPYGIGSLHPKLPRPFLAQQQQSRRKFPRRYNRSACRSGEFGWHYLGGYIQSRIRTQVSRQFRRENIATTWLTFFRYNPTLIATCCCNVTCIFFVLWLGLWMKNENRKRNKEQGVNLRAEDVDIRSLDDGQKSSNWRYFT